MIFEKRIHAKPVWLYAKRWVVLSCVKFKLGFGKKRKGSGFCRLDKAKMSVAEAELPTPETQRVGYRELLGI